MRDPLRPLRPALLGAALVPLGFVACDEPEGPLWEELRGPAPTAAASAEAPDVLVVLLDALRPDHLGAYGYERDTSPFLDRWIEGAALYENAWTHGTQTRIACASLFTGTLPTVHRVRRVEFSTADSFHEGLTDGLAGTLTAWGETLASAGYETWGMSANPNVSEVFGFTQGFARWWQTKSRDGRHIADRFLAACREREAAAPDRPLFAYLHFMDVHNPYDPPAPFDEAFDVPRGERVYENGPIDPSPRDLAYSMALYDGEILYLDGLLREVLAAWEGGAGARPRATLILSDHGDEFLEHGGMGHGKTVFPELAHTLCAFRGPGVEPGRFSDPIAHVDLHRLVLDWAGAAPPGEARGRPRERWSGGEEPPALYTEAGPGLAAFRSGAVTLAWPLARPEEAVWYDRTADPGELQPLPARVGLEEVRGALERVTAGDEELARRLGTPLRDTVGADVLEEMRGLGYVGD